MVLRLTVLPSTDLLMTETESCLTSSPSNSAARCAQILLHVILYYLVCHRRASKKKTNSNDDRDKWHGGGGLRSRNKRLVWCNKRLVWTMARYSLYVVGVRFDTSDSLSRSRDGESVLKLNFEIVGAIWNFWKRTRTIVLVLSHRHLPWWLHGGWSEMELEKMMS